MRFSRCGWTSEQGHSLACTTRDVSDRSPGNVCHNPRSLHGLKDIASSAGHILPALHTVEMQVTVHVSLVAHISHQLHVQLLSP